MNRLYDLDGNRIRKSRFHDEMGNLVGAAAITSFPLSLTSFFLKRYFGVSPCLPYIPIRAARKIRSMLKPGCKVLEFGSGMSTIWLATMGCRVYSIEHNPEWHEFVRDRTKTLQLGDVDCQLRHMENYADVSTFDDDFFDLCLLDGLMRPLCAKNSIPKIRAGGFIYLDNSDVRSRSQPRNQAVKIVCEAAREIGGEYEFISDFPPYQLCVTQGLLASL